MDFRKAAGCIEQATDRVTRWQQERVRSKALDGYDSSFAKFDGYGSDRQHVGSLEHARLEAWVITRVNSDTEMSLTVFEQGGLLRSKGLGQFDLYMGKATG